MALFKDLSTFEEDFDGIISMCCDTCIKAALDANLLAECPVIHGIPLSIGLAFQIENLQPATTGTASSDKIEQVSFRNRVTIRKSWIDKVKDAVRAWRTDKATRIVSPHLLLSEKAISKIGNAVKTKEMMETLICETLEQLGISSKRSAISKHIPALVEVIAKNLSESIDEQPQPCVIPELSRRPLPPPELPFMITEAQIAHDMLAEQATARREAEATKVTRKRKRKAGHLHSPPRRNRAVETSWHCENNLVLHF